MTTTSGNRVAIVTSGSGGIGRQVARKLAGRGHAVVVLLTLGASV
jgi:NAD(P)-dependent dehydrogenase (short-subunit alcohol dehydrogenase family)